MMMWARASIPARLLLSYRAFPRRASSSQIQISNSTSRSRDAIRARAWPAISSPFEKRARGMPENNLRRAGLWARRRRNSPSGDSQLRKAGSLPVTPHESLAQALSTRSDEAGLVPARAAAFFSVRCAASVALKRYRSRCFCPVGTSANLNEGSLLHARHALIATKLCVAAEFRDVPTREIQLPYGEAEPCFLAWTGLKYR
jgi:hypothetical protein